MPTSTQQAQNSLLSFSLLGPEMPNADPTLSHARENGFNCKWEQSSEFLSIHRHGVVLGARNEVSYVAANISFHFLLLDPFAQVQGS